MKTFETIKSIDPDKITLEMEQQISWVKWFLSQPLGKLFVEIDHDYLSNIFNYYGIRQKISNFSKALELIQNTYVLPKDRPKDDLPEMDNYGICLYGLLHNRYLLTEAGIDKMYQKYCSEDFPCCPRFLCHKTKCLPCGESDNMGHSGIKLFCPLCKGLYHYDASPMDGAFFGTSYIPILLVKYPSIVPNGTPESYSPTLYGFQICSKQELDALEEDVIEEDHSSSD